MSNDINKKVHGTQLNYIFSLLALEHNERSPNQIFVVIIFARFAELFNLSHI